MVYLKSVENVITLGKLIGLLFLFCLPLLSILFLKTKKNDLARPVVWVVCTPKPQCECSQFYVKRRSGRACIYEKISILFDPVHVTNRT